MVADMRHADHFTQRFCGVLNLSMKVNLALCGVTENDDWIMILVYTVHDFRAYVIRVELDTSILLYKCVVKKYDHKYIYEELLLLFKEFMTGLQTGTTCWASNTPC